MPQTFGTPPRLLADASDGREAVRKSQMDGALGGYAPAGHSHPYAPVAASQISYASTITPDVTLNASFYVTATGGVLIAMPASAVDGQQALVEVFASGGTRSAGITGSTTNATGKTLPFSVAAGTCAFFGFRYSARAGHWILISATQE